MKYFIGASGWQYTQWRGKFYPDKLPRTQWLDYYAQRFNTVEVNSTFYQLPTEASLERWREETPPGFAVTLKASRYITHVKKLHEADEATTGFLKLAGLLKEKLGVILFQLPPGMKSEDERLEGFLRILPAGFRYAVEFRDASWFNAGVWNILHKHKTAFCIMDMPGLSAPVVATAPFAYVRFHGSIRLYETRYTKLNLEKWAERIKRIPDVSETYIYFNNDFSGFAVENARTMQELLK